MSFCDFVFVFCRRQVVDFFTGFLFSVCLKSLELLFWNFFHCDRRAAHCYGTERRHFWPDGFRNLGAATSGPHLHQKQKNVRTSQNESEDLEQFQVANL